MRVTVFVSGFDIFLASAATMSGHTTLYITGQTIAGHSGHSTSWTSTAENASRSE